MATAELEITGEVAHTPRWHIDRHAAFLAWPLWLVAAGATAIAGLIILATFSTPMPPRMGFRGWVPLAAMLYATVGARIATRHSRNPVGWLVLSIGIVYAFNALAEEYGTWSYYHEHDWLTGISLAAWFAAVAPNLTAAFGAFAYLFFPDGVLRTRFERGFAAVVGALAFLTVAGYAVLPDTLQWDQANQFALPFLRSYPQFAIDPMLGTLYQIRAIVLLAPIVFVLYRLWRATGERRQQLKWVGIAGTFASLAFAMNAFVDRGPIARLVLVLAVLSIPIAIGIAMRRYRLYDIDAILNRAAVWGAITAGLAGLYTAAIILAIRLFPEITSERSDVALVLAIIVIVGTFSPLKDYLQSLAQRWFPAPASTRSLRAFTRELEMHLALGDRERLLRRFADEVMASFRCVAACVCVPRGDALVTTYCAGRWDDDVRLTLTIRDGASVLCEVRLGPRENGSPYTEKHRQTLRDSGEVLRESLLRIA